MGNISGGIGWQNGFHLGQHVEGAVSMKTKEVQVIDPLQVILPQSVREQMFIIMQMEIANYQLFCNNNDLIPLKVT